LPQRADSVQSETFQEDIYPDTLSGESSLGAAEWFSGQDVLPKLLKVEALYQLAPGTRLPTTREFVPSTSEAVLKTIPSTSADGSQTIESNAKFVANKQGHPSDISEPTSEEIPEKSAPEPNESPKDESVLHDLVTLLIMIRQQRGPIG